MKINWKVRFKNPVWWAQVAIAIFLPILGYFGLQPQDVTSWAELSKILFDAIMNPYVVLLIVSSLWNSINDPTVEGISDSKHALSYCEPMSCNHNTQENNINSNKTNEDDITFG